MQVLLYGVNPFNKNRGVNALAYGAVESILMNYPNADIILLGGAKQHKTKWNVKLRSGDYSFNYYYFSKIQFLIATLNGILGFNLISFSNRKIRLFKLDELTRLYKDADIICNVNEGDSFSDIYGPKRFYKHIVASWAAIAHKKKLVLLPQTIGPFYNYFVRQWAKFILKRTSVLYIRDENAVPLLQKEGIHYQKSKDVSQYMKPIRPEMNFETDNFIAINISGLMYLNIYDSLQDKYKIYPDILTKVCSYFDEKGIKILLLPHTYSIDEPEGENDYTAIQKFMSGNQNFRSLMYINMELTAPELKYIITKSQFFIGSRMHACFAALTSGIPCFGLGYSYKFQGGFASFGIKDYGIDITGYGDEKTNSVVNEIISAYQNREKLKEILVENNRLSNPVKF